MYRDVFITNKSNRAYITQYTVGEGGDTSWYPQRMSLNSFQRRYNYLDTGNVYQFDWVLREERIAKVVICETVWEFYTLIGYDYKKKKFI